MALRLAMALSGRIAADLGAKVLRIEDPATEPLRRMAPIVSGRSALYAFLNAGKQLVAPADAALQELQADVLLSPRRELSASNARRQVQVFYSMLGNHVPDDTPNSEFTVLASSGLLNLVGDPAREPLRLGGHQAAYAAGLSGFAGAMGALMLERGETVRVSLLECAVWLNWKNVANSPVLPDTPPPSRAGRSGDWPVVRCKDGWIALVYQPADWARLCALAGNHPRLCEPAMADPIVRARHGEEIARWFEEAWHDRSRAELEQEFMRARLPSGAIWSPQELAQDEQYLARDFLRQLEIDGTGETRALPRLPVLWNQNAFEPGSFPHTATAPAHLSLA
ncbi:MAG: CoA transferase [Pseudomonadota bacterium]